MLFDLIAFLYYIIPAAAIVFFAVSMFRYHYAKFRNKRSPGTYSERQIRTRLICLIVSSVIAGALAAVVIAFVGLLMTAVAFM